MKKYLLFKIYYGYTFAASGGWDNFINDFDSPEEAMQAEKTKDWESSIQIVDRDTKQIVFAGNPQHPERYPYK